MERIYSIYDRINQRNMIIWQQNSSNPDNADNLATIGQWWANLNGKNIDWRQRLIPASDNLDEIDWEPQKFDDKFVIKGSEVRGITLYWQKPDSEQERNLTPYKIQLDISAQKLYIYPQTQQQVVICVGTSEIIYQTIELEDPLIVGTSVEGKCILLLRDRQQQLQVKVILGSQSLAQLRESLPE